MKRGLSELKTSPNQRPHSAVTEIQMQVIDPKK